LRILEDADTKTRNPRIIVTSSEGGFHQRNLHDEWVTTSLSSGTSIANTLSHRAKTGASQHPVPINNQHPKTDKPAMKSNRFVPSHPTAARWRMLTTLACALFGSSLLVCSDETCLSPYMPKITGQEEYIYVWTLGVQGWGDGSDKLVTVDVNPSSKTYGRVIQRHSVGGRHEAHHGGFTDDRRQVWLSGLDTSHIFIYDIATTPSRPRYVGRITDFTEQSGGVTGPHGMYALPGRMLIPGLSNNHDRGGRTAIVEYSNEGNHIATHWMPTDEDPRGAVIEKVADGYGYDARVLPRKNVMLSSSFTGWANYMRNLGDLMQDPESMQRFGQTMVLWDFHARLPKKVFHVPGAPLEVRWAWAPTNNHAFTATALTSKLWLVYEDAHGEWQTKAVADIGDGNGGVIPVDISLSADDKTLFVSCFADGKCRVFDVSDPHEPKQVYETVIGRQVNMVSQSWDGKRLYFTSSLLANWDKNGDDNDQFLKGYDWDGEKLTERFAVDFKRTRLGRPHMMHFGSSQLYQ
jgi:methanethiol oxidase